MSDIVDDLANPNAYPRIIAGGPNSQGDWIIIVMHLDRVLEQTVEGPAQIVQLNLRQLSEWRKRT